MVEKEREREREIEIEIELDRKYFTFKNEGLLMMCQNMLKCVCYYERLFYECIRVYILNIKAKIKIHFLKYDICFKSRIYN